MFPNQNPAFGTFNFFPPPPKVSAMDTSVPPQQPFNFFGGNNFNTTPGTLQLGNATAANAATTPFPASNWGSNNTTNASNNTFLPPPTFGNTPSPATATTPSPFNFTQPTPTFNFSQPQQQQQPQVGFNSTPTWGSPPQTQQTPQINNTNFDPTQALYFLCERVCNSEKMIEHVGNFLQIHSQTCPQLSAVNCGMTYPILPQNAPFYQGGRPSSLALECLQMAATDLQQSRTRNNGTVPLGRFHDNHPSGRPHRDSSLLTPTRKWGSTSLADSYRNEHHYGLPQSQSSHVLFEDRNVLRRRAEGLHQTYHGYSSLDYRRRIPDKNRFRWGYFPKECTSFYYTKPRHLILDERDRISREEESYTSLQRQRDRKWKVLNGKVVKESFEKGDKEFMKPKGEQSLWEWGPIHSLSPDNDLSSVDQSANCKRDDLQNRGEPREQAWSWMNRGLSTGPPLRSHLDDEDHRLYDFLKSASDSRKTIDMKFRLPGMFKYDHGKNNTIKRPAPSTHKVMQEEVETLYYRLHARTSDNSTNEGDQDSHSELPEKTSPVFFTNFKFKPKQMQEPPSNSSSSSAVPSETLGVQTDFEKDDNYFTARFEDLKDKEDDCHDRPARCSNDDGGLQKESSGEKHASGVKLTRELCYCVPDITTLDKMANRNNGACFVMNFEVGHFVHGKVVFPGLTNVAGLDLDKIVEFAHRSVLLYPLDSTDKHKFGEGLYRPARVTLLNVWPKERGGNGGLVKDPEKIFNMGYDNRLRAVCQRMEAEFLNYCPHHGKLTFMIQQRPLADKK